MKKSRWTYRAAAAAMLLLVGSTAYLGWHWLSGLTVTAVRVDGAQHAASEEILAVARVDSGVRMLDVEPALIADRVERHPWVRKAGVHRIPPGIVSIDVTEREPVALALDGQGRPAAYLDAEGYAMPAVESAVYDVPLIGGLTLPENRTRPIDVPSVLQLLKALESIDESADVLISSFAVDASGDVTLYTEPAGGRHAIAVRLGREGFAEKFVNLTAFWQQAVLTRPEIAFDLIDLRFDSQIVTRES